MSQLNFAVVDRLQFRLAQAEFEIQRLVARVAALEAGAPLPPDQVIEVIPAAPPAPEQPQPKPIDQPVADVELDLMSGGLIPTGSKRK
jgi:hypothetical protein